MKKTNNGLDVVSRLIPFEIEAIIGELKNLDEWTPYRSQVLGEPRCVEGGGCCDGASS